VAAADPAIERRALHRSIAVTALLGSVGVVWGIVSGSQMILLDGVYAIIGIVVSWLLLQASAMAQAGPTSRFPYGREAVTPLVIGVQGFILLATLVYALAEGVFTIRDGGSEVAPGPALVYAVLIATANIIFWRWIQRQAAHSDLLRAESTGWRVASLRGVGMLVGFIVLWGLIDSSWARAAPYIDPVMVIITCVAFLPAPVKMVRGTVRELLEGAPSAEIQQPVLEIVRAVCAEFEIENPVVRMTKVGPKLYVEIDAVARPDATIAQEHEVREVIHSRLTKLPFDLWLNFELTPQH
jgi:cation diffusion facilitator family transporter